MFVLRAVFERFVCPRKVENSFSSFSCIIDAVKPSSLELYASDVWSMGQPHSSQITQLYNTFHSGLVSRFLPIKQLIIHIPSLFNKTF